jgi:hypothetical protein
VARQQHCALIGEKLQLDAVCGGCCCMDGHAAGVAATVTERKQPVTHSQPEAMTTWRARCTTAHVPEGHVTQATQPGQRKSAAGTGAALTALGSRRQHCWQIRCQGRALRAARRHTAGRDASGNAGVQVQTRRHARSVRARTGAQRTAEQGPKSLLRFISALRRPRRRGRRQQRCNSRSKQRRHDRTLTSHQGGYTQLR